MSFKFEKEVNHPCAGAIFDANHNYSEKTFDELTIIRCIEMNKDEIAKDAILHLQFANGTKNENDIVNYLYRNYCSTTCNDLSKVTNSYIRDAISLAFLNA